MAFSLRINEPIFVTMAIFGFDKNDITNILSLKLVKEKFRVKFDSEHGNAFVVHKPEGVHLRFEIHKNGLYYHNPAGHQMAMVNTVKDNAEGFSRRQVEQAQRARELQAIVGNPSTADLKAIVQSNQLANCPVTPQDIDRAELIYGPQGQDNLEDPGTSRV